MEPNPPLTFEQARVQAESYAGSKGKLLALLEEADGKAKRYYEFLLEAWESLQIFLRLVRSWVEGKYRAPVESILMLVAALIYFVTPFDLIPDSIPVLGLVDDAAVITCVARANLSVISSFRTWEILSSLERRSAWKSRKKVK
ncbi:MAG TPA: YkvA family protein [Candidatus Dormibacteraeota bacterium]|nr:YkvA family protein [Candidatus Dormibacteraeota bacterium]